MAGEVSQNDKLKSQAEQMNLALDSVLTEEQARELINGRIQDAYLIKAKVDVENRSGALLVLVSAYRKKILELYSMFGNSPILRKIRTFEDYQQYSLDFVEVQNNGGLDPSLSEMIGHAIYLALDAGTIASFLPAWEKKDIANTTLALEKAIIKNSRVNRVKMTAEVDKISSIKFRHKNPMNGVVNPINPPNIPEPIEESGIEQMAAVDEDSLLPYERLINNITKNYSKQILCETMLSPVLGVEFDEVVEGEEILFKLPFSTPQERSTAQALGCVDSQGNLKPLVGKFLKIVNGEGEYHILAQGPSNTIIHSIEERPVKIATLQKKAPASNDKTYDPQQSGNLSILIMGGVAVVVILILLLVLL